ncbi:hypothetical protein DFJ58DRAFT_883165 [Suillus subalutaceus]|uniref:uncharacterized protein n=1 Tax=Suillus subalutaceus TaxID=48586 RepID=UPI001B863859|nr:uncharacterized protein DFJ58DRAFT_883165 [Suillus subalutaceus]KAG1853886.1 hypothetical protein DFJ58DRAFT_883165 [Suillus subalutaceus]
MPAVRQRVRRSARLQADARSRPKAMELPPHPSTSRGRGKARGRGSNPTHNQAPRPAGPKIIVHWTKPSDLHRTDTLVRHLSTNSADARVLFYEGKKTAASNNDERPSGKDKGEIHRFLAKLIFEKDSDYSAAYAEDPKKFDVAVGNRIVSLKKSFKEQLNKFNKTGAGVTPLDENAAANLHKQVLLEFPCRESTMPGTSMHLFIHVGGLVPPRTQSLLALNSFNRTLDSFNRTLTSFNRPLTSFNRPLTSFNRPLTSFPQTLSSLPQTLSSLPQTLSPPLQDSRLPLPNQLDTGAQRSPPAYLPPSHHPPPHFTGAGGSPVDDPDGDLYDDPYADDNGPLSAPLGNALDVLDGDVNMYDDDDDDDGVEYNSSRCRVVSSPPKVPLLLPLLSKLTAFVLPRKPQTPAYHSRMAFGSASPGSQAPRRPPSFASSSGISRSRSTPSSTASSSYQSTDYRISPTASQTSLSAKPQSSAGSKKKRTSATDVEGHLSMLNDEIRSMQSDMSERQGSRNERYTIKMNYQSQKKEFQWRCESRSHDVLLSATTHQREQEAKDKEILRLQAAAALQEKEAETWRLKIQYETMIRAGPSTSSPSV